MLWIIQRCMYYKEHHEVECEHVMWLEDIGRWSTEHRRAAAMLAQVQAALLDQDAAVEAHAGTVRAHELRVQSGTSGRLPTMSGAAARSTMTSWLIRIKSFRPNMTGQARHTSESRRITSWSRRRSGASPKSSMRPCERPPGAPARLGSLRKTRAMGLSGQAL